MQQEFLITIESKLNSYYLLQLPLQLLNYTLSVGLQQIKHYCNARVRRNRIQLDYAHSGWMNMSENPKKFRIYEKNA